MPSKDKLQLGYTTHYLLTEHEQTSMNVHDALFMVHFPPRPAHPSQRVPAALLRSLLHREQRPSTYRGCSPASSPRQPERWHHRHRPDPQPTVRPGERGCHRRSRNRDCLRYRRGGCREGTRQRANIRSQRGDRAAQRPLQLWKTRDQRDALSACPSPPRVHLSRSRAVLQPSKN
ncbi:uncharacterized protein LOC124418036 [Gallus gallus]|uniref:uncharacterized protein LOC124418036 n=1 Tax=Gallus gallus TaxID=9031 RepID=UPI001F01F4DF|nr:uncharacterized protein LOC124418036 [Gallus gallus]